MPTKRIALTIQLSPKSDADLVEKVRQMTYGNRNSELRGVLRAGFMLPSVSSSSTEDNGAVQQQLVSMQNTINALSAQIAQMQTLLLQIAEGAEVTRPTTPPPEVEAVPQLTREELDRRAKKLSKTKW